MCRIHSYTDPGLYEPKARSVRIMGVITTIKMENLFWHALSSLAAASNMTTNQLIATLHAEVSNYVGKSNNFTSFLRVTCLRHQLMKNMPAPEAEHVHVQHENRSTDTRKELTLALTHHSI